MDSFGDAPAAASRFQNARKQLQDGIGRVCSAAVLLVAQQRRIVFEQAVGWTARPGLGVERARVHPETVFDVASLTKPLATAAVAMRLLSRGLLDLDAPLGSVLPEALETDKAGFRLWQLFAHCAGLPAWRPFAADLVRENGLRIAGTRRAREAVLRMILAEPIEAPPGSRAVYSDLGYILLGFALERVAHARLDRVFDREVARPLGLRRTFFVRIRNGRPEPPALPRSEFAATERCPTRSRVLQAEVHDDNAFVLGGVAGHAGLFATAREVHAILHAMTAPDPGLFDRGVVREFMSLKRCAPGSQRTPGFDTPTPGASSAGSRHPEDLVGHLGFTGTSFWMMRDGSAIVVLLTNRVHPTRANEAIRDWRPAVHDAVWEALRAAG